MQQLSDIELKQVELEILVGIDRICRENNLKYFISYGTLIGAVRHKGFIPWDDDVDICMPREDYNNFEKIMKTKEEYRLISMSTDPDYYFSFARVCDKNTTLVLKKMREIHNFGVFVDVFPIDNAPPIEEREEWLKQYIELKEKIVYTTPSTAKYQDKSFRTMMRRIGRIPKRLLYGASNFNLYRNELHKLMTKYNDSTSEELIVGETYWKVRKVFKKQWVDNIIDIEFENRNVKAPLYYEEMLTELYGDYMKLPPVEDRVSHHRFTAYWL